jgi:hypothetical protein
MLSSICAWVIQVDSFLQLVRVDPRVIFSVSVRAACHVHLIFRNLTTTAMMSMTTMYQRSTNELNKDAGLTCVIPVVLGQ